VPTKEDIKAIAKEITDGAMSELTVDNFAGARAIIDELCRSLRTAGRQVLHLVYPRA
jgi:hypothetical protein